MFVIGSLQCGGAERVMSDMANFWADKGWQVTVATWSAPRSTDFYRLAPAVTRVYLNDGDTANSAFAKSRSLFSRVLRLRRLLAHAGADAVLSFIHISNVLTILSTLGIRGLRVVVSERNHPLSSSGYSGLWRLLRRVLYGRADAVVAQTAAAAAWVDRACRVKTSVIANPLRPLPELRADREAMILAVGSLTRKKGFDLLIRSFAKIQAAVGGWRVVIVGAGPEEKSLLDLRDRLGLAHRVEIRRPVKDIETWMARAGLVVQPSRFEGFPNVVLEAMSMGAAVISADCPWGPADIVSDGVNGRLVPVEDVDTLAQTMAELIAQPRQRRRFGEAARKVREEYGQEKIMAQWQDCLLPNAGGGQGGSCTVGAGDPPRTAAGPEAQHENSARN